MNNNFYNFLQDYIAFSRQCPYLYIPISVRTWRYACSCVYVLACLPLCVCICLCMYMYMCMYMRVCMYVVYSISCHPFFVQEFKTDVDSWKFSILLLYKLWDDWSIFMIWGSNEQLHKELEYIQLKPDCHSWCVSKMQSGREDTLEQRYAIKFCFKLEKMPQKRMESFRLFSTTLRESSISFWVA